MITFKEFKNFIDDHYPQWSPYVYKDNTIHIGVSSTYCLNIDEYVMSICDANYPVSKAQYYNLQQYVVDDTLWQFIDEKLRENQESIQAFIDKVSANFIPDRCEKILLNCGFYAHKYNNRMKVYRYTIDNISLSITPPHDFTSDFTLTILNLNKITDIEELKFTSLDECLEYITK